jgi:diguanylate cyclase (GGDEF)-like protein
MKGRADELERVAHHDSLTGLPNRHLLLDRLGQAMAFSRRNQKGFAVCFVDLDGFKPINDNYGHEAGDYVLKEVGRRLNQTIRENDTVARLGGDEFVVMLVDIEERSDCKITLGRILTAIKNPIKLPQGIEVSVSLSMGVTVYPEDPGSPSELIEHSDQAMYLAKRSNPGGYTFYQSL